VEVRSFGTTVAWNQFAWGSKVSTEGQVMLRWALIFLVVAIIAAIFGFSGVAGDAAWIARVLFFLFLIVFVVSLLVGSRGPNTV
jgi:uncharacterized membrane protein YtjA (UPF0391 family)